MIMRRLLLSAFFFALFCEQVLSLEILFYLNLVGSSHLQLVSSLINKLTDRGHTVDLIIARLNSAVSSNGKHSARRVVSVDFPGVSPWNAAADHLLNPFDDSNAFNPFSTPFTIFFDVNSDLCELVLDSAEVSSLLSSTHYDIAIVSSYDYCPFGLLHHHRVSPLVTYAATPAMPIQIMHGGIPQLPLYENDILNTRGHYDHSRFSHRVVQSLRSIVNAWNSWEFSDQMNMQMRRRFGADFPDVEELATNSSLDFSNANPLLDEPRPLSNRFRLFGGVGLPHPAKLSKELDAMLNISARGAVLFSFGTQVPSDKIPLDIVNIFVESFKLFPEFSFIWKYDSTIKLNASNVFNVDWLPQTDMLYDSRVVAFISHMGLNSFTEASYAGVPLLCIPLFADQMHNARRTVALGTGVIVPKGEVTLHNMREALQKILLQPAYADKAREVAAMLRDHPDTPTRIFVEGVEYAAKHKSLHEYVTPSAARRSFFVSQGFDVIAFLTISSLLLVISMLYISTKICGVVFRGIQGLHVKSKTE